MNGINAVEGPLLVDLDVTGDLRLDGHWSSCYGETGSGDIIEFSGSDGFVIRGGGAGQRHFELFELLIRTAPGAPGTGRKLDVSGNIVVRTGYLRIQGGQSAEGGVVRVGPGAVLEHDTLGSLRVSGGQATGDGGGILIDGGALVGEFVEVEANVAGGRGGGIACRNGGTIRGVWSSSLQVSQNQAELGGGGIALDGCAMYDLPRLSVTDNLVGAAGEGGGLWIGGGSTAVLQGRLFTWPAVLPMVAGNTAAVGGGIYVTGVSTSLQLLETQLLGNTAATGGAIAVAQGAVVSGYDLWLTGNQASAGSAAAVDGSTFGATLLLESAFLSQQSGGTLVDVHGGGQATLALTTAAANDLAGAPALAAAGPGSRLELLASLALDGAVFGPPDPAAVVEADCVAALDLNHFPNEPRPGSYYLAGSAAEILVRADGSAPGLRAGTAAIDYCDGAAWLPTVPDIDGEPRVFDLPPAGSTRLGILDLGADEVRQGLFFGLFEVGDCSEWSSWSGCG